MFWVSKKVVLSLLSILLLTGIAAADYVQQKDDLFALWSFYKFNYISNGKVVSHDEKGITTSEGQSYAMLRAVWANDQDIFDTVWEWTRKNLRRDDGLFAWKYKNQVLDWNAATDADVDIALALLLASRKFSDETYASEAIKIMNSIWENEVVKVDSSCYLTAGNWAPKERYPTIHVAYLAPYAYETFASVDTAHPWEKLVESSYKILDWIYFEQELSLPPEIIYLNKKDNTFYLKRPNHKDRPVFSYDAFPIFWRVAVDYRWYGRKQEKLRTRMLEFFQSEWKKKRKFLDTYTCDGVSRSEIEGLPLYATVSALASVNDKQLAGELKNKLGALWEKAVSGEDTPYYLHNWLWFGKAFELKAIKNFNEFLDFLSPMEYRTFSVHFPWLLLISALLLYLIMQIVYEKFYKPVKIAFLALSFYICVRYLAWRLLSTLNFLEPAGPFISISLWVAEVYCFFTVVFLLIQVGLKPQNHRKKITSPSYNPTVDIFIPIYSESVEILRKTVIAAQAIKYENKRIHICDDSHKSEVVQLASQMGVNYIRGPKQHAKAGNLNNAFTKTDGELLVVFDTDHIPVNTFLSETVPYFSDPETGMLQTPHNFSNSDIFQRAFSKEKSIPDESAMFNHGIQGARDNWGGAFFVGSGAVFRRKAIEEIGGFQLLSITEDIHTSQHLHAHGWKSVFVDKNLLCGLSAENLSSYIVQRRRWMLGCLQIFFKDNPLFMKNLPIRHKLGYFASLFYFFYPIPKVIFWITPLYYLFFHLHPIFSDVTILLAYLVPYMIIVPLLNSAILPKWPRMLWGQAYENIIFFQMFRSVFDLFLPKKLAFKVTPKGLTSDKRVFDYRSSMAVLIASGISVVAIAKGVFEFNYFGIEQDAYFFNIGWAVFNLLFLLSSLIVAWERPQRRIEERATFPFKCRIVGEEGSFVTETLDLSIDGLGVKIPEGQIWPQFAIVEFENSLRIGAQMVYCEKIFSKESRAGYQFKNMDPELKKRLFLMIFSSPQTWEKTHEKRPKNSAAMVYHYFTGLVKGFLPQRTSRRLTHRQIVFTPAVMLMDKKPVSVLIYDRSEKGLGVIVFSTKKPIADTWSFHDGKFQNRAEMVYTKKILPLIWRAGLRFVEDEKVLKAEQEMEMIATMKIGDRQSF